MFNLTARHNPLRDEELHALVVKAYTEEDKAAAAEANEQIVERARTYATKSLKEVGIEKLMHTPQDRSDLTFDKTMPLDIAYHLAVQGAAGITMDFVEGKYAHVFGNSFSNGINKALHAGSTEFIKPDANFYLPETKPG